MKKVISLALSTFLLICMMLPAFAAEDITADPMVFKLNKNTTDISGGDAANSSSSYATMQVNQYLQYTVNTENAATYSLSFTCGTAAGKSTSLQVSVNGTVQIASAPLVDSGGHSTRVASEIGNITLSAGANVIRFKALGGAAVCTQFTLTKLRSVYSIDVKQANFTEGEYYVTTSHSVSGWWDNGNFIIMRGANGSNDDTWIQKTITVEESGWYGLNAYMGTSDTGFVLQVDVDGATKLSKEIEPTGAYSTYADREIGNVYLEAGERTIRFVSPTAVKAAFLKTLTFGEAKEEIKDGKWSKSITPTSIYSHSGYSSGDADLSYNFCVNLRGSKKFTVVVYTEKALTYELTASYGTSQADETIAVSVNGNTQLAAAPLDLTGNYSITGGHHVGYITLNRGINEITFGMGQGADNAIVMSQVDLTLADSFQNDVFTAWVREGAVPEIFFSGDNAGWYTAAGSKCATMRANSYTIYDVYTEEEHVVNVTVDMASSENISFSLDVNGKTVISKESIGKPSTGYTKFGQVTSPTLVTIPAGHSTIKYLQTAGAGNLRSLVFEDADVNEAYILDFAVENKDGGRMVYAARDGLEAYAAVTVRKLGEVDDSYLLTVAQYDGKELVDASTITVDVSDIAHKETKTIKSKLVLKGTGTAVKGFLWDSDTLAPLAESITYPDVKIFPDNVLDTYVNYQLATDTLNNDGVNYAEYGVHDDTYDIDAIFYDGYNGTKVYAYIGIPKTASADHKVPAMVLVHGGIGKAEISWVKKWNDLGIAAIAMDLYGGGPEADSSTSNGKKKHPYAGIEPWGSAAFLADFEKAGMYQTVISVINAHNLLRQDERVDNDRIGITGISWGGVTTTTTIGVDNRFMFAAPVYGCGYLDQCRTGFGSSFSGSTKSILWDPANFAAKATMPVLYVNGDQDAHFSINATSDSACVTKDATISIHHALAHSQGAGDSVQQIYRYAQNMFSGKNTNLRITDSSVENGVLTANYTKPEGTTITKVTLYYITSDDLAYGGGSAIGWKSVTTYTDSGNAITVDIPEGATFCYASITDNYGDIISTKYIKVK